MKLNYGIIGTGMMGCEHIRNLKKIPNVKIVAIADPDDEIILLRPYYFNHEMSINMINCKPVIVDTDLHYQPCMEKIIAAITPNTRANVTV